MLDAGSITDRVMARLILIICAIGVVWFVLRRALPRHKRTNASEQPPQFTPTVRCRICGAYLDRRLASQDDNGYCCQSHHSEHEPPRESRP